MAIIGEISESAKKMAKAAKISKYQPHLAAIVMAAKRRLWRLSLLLPAIGVAAGWKLSLAGGWLYQPCGSLGAGHISYRLNYHGNEIQLSMAKLKMETYASRNNHMANENHPAHRDINGSQLREMAWRRLAANGRLRRIRRGQLNQQLAMRHLTSWPAASAIGGYVIVQCNGWGVAQKMKKHREIHHLFAELLTTKQKRNGSINKKPPYSMAITACLQMKRHQLAGQRSYSFPKWSCLTLWLRPHFLREEKAS